MKRIRYNNYGCVSLYTTSNIRIDEVIPHDVTVYTDFGPHKTYKATEHTHTHTHTHTMTKKRELWANAKNFRGTSEQLLCWFLTVSLMGT